MSRSTVKKVLVHRFERETVSGFVDPLAYLKENTLEILLTNGVLQTISFEEVKEVCFVKDFEAAKTRPDQRAFQSRPKFDGLWVELSFRDGDTLEGVLPNNLAASEPNGFTITPPNSVGNTQRVFVPRQALVALTVKAVIGLKATKKAKESSSAQPSLFTELGSTPNSGLGLR